MNTYTLHLPTEARPGDRDALDRAEVVKDGFSGRSFFSVLWFFYNRLWLAGLGVLAVMVAFGAGLAALGVRTGPASSPNSCSRSSSGSRRTACAGPMPAGDAPSSTWSRRETGRRPK